MVWVVVSMGGEVHAGFLCENLKERDNLKDLGVDVRIILKQIFKKMGGVDRDKLGGGSHEHGNEPWGSIKCG